MARELHYTAHMTNDILYGAIGVTGDPLTTTVITIDGSLVMAVGLAALLVAGVLLMATVRRWKGRRRFAIRQVLHTRRAAV